MGGGWIKVEFSFLLSRAGITTSVSHGDYKACRHDVNQRMKKLLFLFCICVSALVTPLLTLPAELQQMPHAIIQILGHLLMVCHLLCDWLWNRLSLYFLFSIFLHIGETFLDSGRKRR